MPSRPRRIRCAGNGPSAVGRPGRWKQARYHTGRVVRLEVDEDVVDGSKARCGWCDSLALCLGLPEVQVASRSLRETPLGLPVGPHGKACDAAPAPSRRTTSTARWCSSAGSTAFRHPPTTLCSDWHESWSSPKMRPARPRQRRSWSESKGHANQRTYVRLTIRLRDEDGLQHDR